MNLIPAVAAVCDRPFSNSFKQLTALTERRYIQEMGSKIREIRVKDFLDLCSSVFIRG